jgi:diketogulonate reductase-like aldo/keto reductase
MEMVTLNNGIQMPIIGYGTYKVVGQQCVDCVKEAISAGYRMIDTAQAYGNELDVGRGIKECGVAREEIFVITKVWFRSHESGQCRDSILQSMKHLGMDYIDLVMIHWPFGNTYAAWRDLEKLYAEKKVRAIGVSNYMASQLIDLIEFNDIVPAVNQVETNLVCQQLPLQKVMAQYKVAHQAYSPLGQGRLNAMFGDPLVLAIADKYRITARQVALRYLIQSGISVIPRSVDPRRMRENLDIFSFKLAQDEMMELKALDKETPLIGSSQDPDFVASAMTW